MMVKLTCMRQGCSRKTFRGPAPQMCCSGRDCGCMGMLIEPVICSRRCWKKFDRDRKKAEQEYYEKMEEQRYYEEQAAYEEQYQREMRTTCIF